MQSCRLAQQSILARGFSAFLQQNYNHQQSTSFCPESSTSLSERSDWHWKEEQALAFLARHQWHTKYTYIIHEIWLAKHLGESKPFPGLPNLHTKHPCPRHGQEMHTGFLGFLGPMSSPKAQQSNPRHVQTSISKEVLYLFWQHWQKGFLPQINHQSGNVCHVYIILVHIQSIAESEDREAPTIL